MWFMIDPRSWSWLLIVRGPRIRAIRRNEQLEDNIIRRYAQRKILDNTSLHIARYIMWYVKIYLKYIWVNNRKFNKKSIGKFYLHHTRAFRLLVVLVASDDTGDGLIKIYLIIKDMFFTRAPFTNNPWGHLDRRFFL